MASEAAKYQTSDDSNELESCQYWLARIINKKISNNKALKKLEESKERKHQ